MHRKSLEAAEHLKDDNTTSSDHEESTSMRTDASDSSATSSQQPSQPPPPNHAAPGDKDQQQQQQQPHPSLAGQQAYNDDPEAFRNNSIACLRAKAQEHSAKLLNHNLMLHIRPNPQSCDANANNLHHQEVVTSESNQAIFWQNADGSA